MKTPYEKLANIYINCSGHIAKMATMPIYGKNPLKNFFSRTRRQMTLDLVCSIGYVGPTKIAQVIDVFILYDHVKFDSKCIIYIGKILKCAL